MARGDQKKWIEMNRPNQLEFMVGTSVKIGQIVCISRNGNLRPVASKSDYPVGVALETLRRGRRARLDQESKFHFREINQKENIFRA